ncbi:diaminopimelate decarboxylase [Candidatus Viadribacter manganicus]|uniref:Diaminopimelate decarboxylase n=1 Tax=Candidatus Viadribacter manganicus TaxID=1759059 RepID=A0A1B1AFM6_9PROT|nr:diaminopimelate decarboxylase [Candidatus Viadribacter manganicus]ANP45358.1 diaminopimelate decarboxylase [Candidatus Viadribacter manganicus]
MNHFEYRGGAFCCEGVKLAEIAEAVGTPCYVYSTATLERHYDVFRSAFGTRDVLVAFAVKANSNIAVLATLARKGAGADTVSQGEIERALMAGAPASKIIFSGVGKTAEELTFAVKAGVHQINVESRAELELLAEIARGLGKKAPIAIRVNPDVGAGGHEKISTGKGDAKFGVSPEQALALFARAADDPHLHAQGLAVHIGSQIRDLAPLEAAFRVMRSLAEKLRGDGIPIERLDLGGGLGVPYFNEPDPPSPAEYAAMVGRVFDGFDIGLSFEPGRMIAANAGVLVSRVVRLQERPRPIVVLDAAMNDLIRPAIYDAYHGIKPLNQPKGAEQAYDVVGPICETGDTFTRNRMLPPLEAGDLVAFMTAGAYGAVMASTYNARALVPEVLVSGDTYEIVRRRWDVAEQLKLETLPSWLATKA